MESASRRRSLAVPLLSAVFFASGAGALLLFIDVDVRWGISHEFSGFHDGDSLFDFGLTLLPL